MSDEEVLRVLKENKIGLTVVEAREVEKILGRGPCSQLLVGSGYKKNLKLTSTSSFSLVRILVFF